MKLIIRIDNLKKKIKNSSINYFKFKWSDENLTTFNLRRLVQVIVRSIVNTNYQLGFNYSYGNIGRHIYCTKKYIYIYLFFLTRFNVFYSLKQYRTIYIYIYRIENITVVGTGSREYFYIAIEYEEKWTEKFPIVGLWRPPDPRATPRFNYSSREFRPNSRGSVSQFYTG